MRNVRWKMQLRRFELSTDVIIIIVVIYNVYQLATVMWLLDKAQPTCLFTLKHHNTHRISVYFGIGTIVIIHSRLESCTNIILKIKYLLNIFGTSVKI